MKIFFITTNINKYKEAKQVLEEYNIKLMLLKYPLMEIQSKSLVESIIWKGAQGFKILDEYYIVEDAGLFIKPLKGFPGVYSSYVYKTIGIDGILKLMDNISNREAYFEAVGFLSLKNNIFKLFVERVHGIISNEIRGDKGFGFDPIFIPKGSNKTYAEMDLSEKNRFSHRGKLFRKIGEYIRNNILHGKSI